MSATSPSTHTTSTARSRTAVRGLWNLVAELKGERYRWVDLTHTLSAQTPHWYGFSPFASKLLFDYLPGTPDAMAAPMRCYEYSVASQYGTHVDAPRHFWATGRALDAIRWLVHERNIAAIGHEPADTDPARVTTRKGFYPYPAEQYILAEDRFQIEVMDHLDEVPETGALIVCAFPKLLDGVGYPARCFAICPVEE